MRLVAVQLCPPHGDALAGRALLEDALTEALRGGADLVVTPEMSTSGYVFDSPEALRTLAEPADGPTFAIASRLARAHGASMVIGIAERAPDGALFNSALLVGPDGALLDVYRKVLLFDLDRTWARPGDRRVTVSAAPLGRVTPGICMDLNDDGFTAYLRNECPDVVAFCSNWLDQGFPVAPYWQWRTAGWSGWFVAANRWGAEGAVPFRGESAILTPWGTVAAQAPIHGDAILRVDTDALRRRLSG